MKLIGCDKRLWIVYHRRGEIAMGRRHKKTAPSLWRSRGTSEFCAAVGTEFGDFAFGLVAAVPALGMLRLAALGAKFGVVDGAAGAEPLAFSEDIGVRDASFNGVFFGIGVRRDDEGDVRAVRKGRLPDSGYAFGESDMC